ncbi:uncharacterized protein LOC131557256 [Ammospiza caudacuta]|uniref:uncharacterized protein LOC131557256 n=1 Tax=Ammospiza caudacuta TaxID=2857398 RepID=UPI002739B7BF|nr:uncharacterized protein LOC131557256 [Ammospiza caudacuta]
MEQRAPRVPKLVCVEDEEEEGPGAAPAQDTEEAVPFSPPQEAESHAWSRPWNVPLFPPFLLLQTLRRLLRLGRTKTSSAGTEGTAQPDSRPGQLRAEPAASSASLELAAASEQDTAQGRAEAGMALTEGTATTHTQAQGMPGTQAMPTLTGTPAPTMEVLQKVAASPKQVQATVRDILWRLASCVTVDGGLHMEILSMTEEHPAQVVMSLLRCAPTCDRATTVMWRAMGTSRVAAQEVLPALLSAMEEQPPYGSFSCGDNKAVLALAATLVLWRIAHMCEWHCAILLHSPQLFVALFLQIVTTTEQMPGDVETRSFWRACWEEHGLPSEPNRFAAQTMKALLSRLGFGKNLLASEHKVPHTVPGAVSERALSPREGRADWERLGEEDAQQQPPPKGPMCPCRVLGKDQTSLLECLDLSKHGPSALLVLFCKVMELVVEEGEELLMTIVNQSLLPLFLRCHDENLQVAKVRFYGRCPIPGRGLGHFLPRHLAALLCAARFLRRRDLEELLTEERRMKFAESLLLQDESQVAEHLRWALPHLQSPQRPLREAAVRFIGVAGVLMMGQKEELQVLTEALQALKEDESPSCMSKVLQMTFERRCAGLCSSAGSDVPASIVWVFHLTCISVELKRRKS